MDRETIKEALNNYRLNKTLLWNTLIITIGGTIGLFFKAVSGKSNFIDIVFVVLGCFLVIVLTYAVGEINATINKLWVKFKDIQEHKK